MLSVISSLGALCILLINNVDTQRVFFDINSNTSFANTSLLSNVTPFISVFGITLKHFGVHTLTMRTPPNHIV